MKFPEFPATFPAVETKSADYGQNSQDGAVAPLVKFATKFAEAGN